MVATTTQLTTENIPKIIANAFYEGQKQAVVFYWDIFMVNLKQHWLIVFGAISVILAIATVKAMLGRWGMLGSALYNLFYLGVIFVIVLIMGPEIILSDFFHAFLSIILYPICYLVVGWILDYFGFRSRRY